MKSKPKSVRFDEEKLKFFQEKYPELDTHQKVVDNFLDMFWWQHHLKGNANTQYPLTPDECVNTQPNKETPKNSPKNESNKVLSEDDVEKIGELTKAANACQDTKLGKLAKAGYLTQIERLQNKNK